jgi:nickel-dependent lactate racemase
LVADLDNNVAWHEIEKNRDTISKLGNDFDLKLAQQNNKMKEGEKKHAGMIVALSQVINSMRNDQYGGKRKTRGKKEDKTKKRKKRKKKKTKKRFRNQSVNDKYKL